jgi:hypothetical protein
VKTSSPYLRGWKQESINGRSYAESSMCKNSQSKQNGQNQEKVPSPKKRFLQNSGRNDGKDDVYDRDI